MLTRLSLFSETSDDSVTVHRLVQDIIQEDVDRTEQLDETITNAQRMLARAVGEQETTIHKLLSFFKDSKEWQVPSLDT